MEYKNAKFIENNSIDCEINHPKLGWIPFTVDKSDTGSDIDVVNLYNEIISSGNVAPYVPPTAEELLEEATVEANMQRKYLLETIVDPLVMNPLRWGDLTAQEQERVKKYRRALLDITDQDGFPHNIEWPTY